MNGHDEAERRVYHRYQVRAAATPVANVAARHQAIEGARLRANAARARAARKVRSLKGLGHSHSARRRSQLLLHLVREKSS